MAAQWDAEFRTTFTDCNSSRCRHNEPPGQCHLRSGHEGPHDPFGLSHWEMDKDE